MNITITGRHFEVTPPLKEYAHKRLLKINKYFSQAPETHVILSVEKYRHCAEMNISYKGTRFHSQEVTEDMYSSLDKAVTKLEHQVKKYKEKLKSKNNTDAINMKAHSATEEEGEEEGDDEEDDRRSFADHPQIIMTEGFQGKPMTPEDAIISMNEKGHSFLVFLNSSGERVNVIYKRQDRNYGLIQPMG